MRASFTSVEEARRIARRILPGSVYDFIDGGTEGEYTSIANTLAFRRVLFSPKVGSGITTPDVTTSVFGQRISMPVIIAPTGFIRMVHPDGELGAARAAAAAGIPIAISSVSSVPAQAIVSANDSTWFQLYMLGGREGAGFSIDVARRAHCRVLVVTVDVAASTPRDCPGRPLPMEVNLATSLRFLPQAWNKPRWLLSVLRGGFTTHVPNAPRKPDGSEMALSDFGSVSNLPPSWDDLAWIRAQWTGQLLVKGILRADDAKRAIDLGADGICVSNHGAKVLDGKPSALSVLPEIVAAVGSQTEVLLDGGVRRGADVVRACALGAKAVLIGRPYIWGLAAGGEAGVEQILRIFHRGIGATLANLGCPSVDSADPSWLRPLPDHSRWNEV